MSNHGVQGLSLAIRDISVKSQSLSFVWQLRNRSDEPMLVAAWLDDMARREQGPLNADRCYIKLDNDGIVRIGKWILGTGPGLNVYFPDVPLLERVPPADLYEQRVFLKLPIRPYDPYQNIAISDANPISQSKGWSFAVSVIPGIYVEPIVNPISIDDRALYTVMNQPGLTLQAIIDTDIFADRLPVYEIAQPTGKN